MSAIARIAFHVDSLRGVIPEHEGNFIIDSYFAYLVEGRDKRGGSVCTDECGELAKRELAAFGDDTIGEAELMHEADANMALRIEAQRRAQFLATAPIVDHPATAMTASEELSSIL